MSIPYRSSNGRMTRVNFDTDSLVKLDSINYFFKDFDSANKANKILTNGMDELFTLKEEYYNLMMNNTLYPAYYLVSYDQNKIYSDSVDLIKFGDVIIDQDTFTFGIDLQLFNNIIFMIGNSDQMTTFNGSRNIWYKVMEAYSILVDKNERSLRTILATRYGYNEERIQKYRDDLEKYVYSFYEKIIESLMEEKTCYDCFRFVKSMSETSLRKKIYSDLSDRFDDFITDLLISKINSVTKTGYYADLFEEQFFANEILSLQDLNARKKKQIIDSLYDFYLNCINVRKENNDNIGAKNCYDILYNNKEVFDNVRIHEIEKLKDSIESNYNNDPKIKNKETVQKLNKFGNDVLPKVGIVLILAGIIGLIGSLITLFKNIIWLSILGGSIVLLIILFFVDKANTKTIDKKRK